MTRKVLISKILSFRVPVNLTANTKLVNVASVVFPYDKNVQIKSVRFGVINNAIISGPTINSSVWLQFSFLDVNGNSLMSSVFKNISPGVVPMPPSCIVDLRGLFVEYQNFAAGGLKIDAMQFGSTGLIDLVVSVEVLEESFLIDDF